MNYERLRAKFDREYPEIFYRMNTSRKYFNGDLVGYDWRILKIEHSEGNSAIQTVATGFEYSEVKAKILMDKLISKMEREDKKAKRKAWRNKKKEYKKSDAVFGMVGVWMCISFDGDYGIRLGSIDFQVDSMGIFLR